ncbi:hypothetical protein Tco_0999910 [Tanacetum coccineum]
MANLKYSDKHNMVAFLKKPNESVGFTEVVDFLKGTSLRYALTHNPTIYDSLVKQFWQTATVRTLANGTQQLVASIDSKEYIITEASVRSKLQLADATGIHNLSDAEIYAGLATLGAAVDQEGAKGGSLRILMMITLVSVGSGILEREVKDVVILKKALGGVSMKMKFVLQSVEQTVKIIVKRCFSGWLAEGKKSSDMWRRDIGGELGLWLKKIDIGLDHQRKIGKYMREELQSNELSKNKGLMEKRKKQRLEKVTFWEKMCTRRDSEESVEAMNPTPLCVHILDRVELWKIFTAGTMFDPPLIDDAFGAYRLHKKMDSSMKCKISHPVEFLPSGITKFSLPQDFLRLENMNVLCMLA